VTGQRIYDVKGTWSPRQTSASTRIMCPAGRPGQPAGRLSCHRPGLWV